MPPLELALPFDSLVLVTGANGFIGSYAVNTLLELGLLTGVVFAH
jgi:uncharacterized protein YbjT (DUF2867 family)